MTKPAIASAKDIENFFDAYNDHDWDTVFSYISEDCVWDAAEKRMEGRNAIIDYWTKYHSAFKETLRKPEKVLFGDHIVYLQVTIRLDFLEDGTFFGKTYKKGETLDFACADYYELDDEGKIRLGYIYIKFFNP
jgi:hypothetical protein